MRADHEELVLRNPAAGACACWYFSRAFCDEAKGKSPELPFFLLAEAMFYHRPTVEKIRGMQFDSGIVKAVSEKPDIIAGLQQRLEDNAHRTLLSLQFGCSTKLLLREQRDGFPSFRAQGTLLPMPIRDGDGDLTRIYAASKRLGRWFASEGMAKLQQLMKFEF